MLHTLNYTTLDISNQSLNLNNFKIIGKFKVVGNSSNISGHPSEGFHIPFLFENYDSFQIIHYPERYYFRIKDNSNNWLAWQRHKHKIADIDGLQTTLDSFTNSISSIQSTLNSHSNSISSIQSTLNSHSNIISSIQSTLNSLNARVSALENISIRLPPGVILAVAWNPGFYTGKRVLPLHGQGIPINNDYSGLVNATYVGDSLNGTAHFFYKYNLSTGTRSTNGDYFRLPDTKALVPKGRGDLGAGATYFGGRVKYNSNIMGNLQEDMLQSHIHSLLVLVFTNQAPPNYAVNGLSNVTYNRYVETELDPNYYRTLSTYGRAGLETRDSSFAVDFVITY